METKTRNYDTDDDDDGLGFDLGLDDDDDDGLGFDLGLDDDDDDGLGFDLGLDDDDDDDDDEVPELEFESEYSKTQTPKKSRKKNKHSCLKLPLVSSLLNGASGEKRQMCRKLFVKAGRSRDAVMKAEIAVKEAKKTNKEKYDIYAKTNFEKDVREELTKSINSEKLVKELVETASGLNKLKINMKENHKKMQELKRASNTAGGSSKMKNIQKLETEKKQFLEKRQKDLSRQKVLRSEVVGYEGSLAKLEDRLKEVESHSEEMYSNLTKVQEKIKRNKSNDGKKAGPKKSKQEKEQERVGYEQEELEILTVIRPKIATLKRHMIRIKEVKKLRQKANKKRAEVEKLKMQLYEDPNMKKRKADTSEDQETKDGKETKEGNKKSKSKEDQFVLDPDRGEGEGKASIESIQRTQKILTEHNKLFQEESDIFKLIIEMEKGIQTEHKEMQDAQAATKRAEKRLKLCKTLEEREIKECSKFTRSFGRKLLLETHPDKLNREPTEEERTRFESLQLAHATLGNIKTLRRYLSDGSVLAAKMASTTSSSSSSSPSSDSSSSSSRNTKAKSKRENGSL